MASLGEKGLRKRDGQIGLVNPFPPRSSPLMSTVISSGVRQSKVAGVGRSGRERVKKYTTFSKLLMPFIQLRLFSTSGMPYQKCIKTYKK